MTIDRAVKTKTYGKYYWKDGDWFYGDSHLKVTRDLAIRLNYQYRKGKILPPYKRNNKIPWKTGGVNHLHPYQGGIPGGGKKN